MISTLIIEPNHYLREAWQTFIDLEEGMSVAQTFANYEDFISSSRRYHAEIVIMELGSAKLKGVNQTKRLFPDKNILIITNAEDNELTFKALQVGAVGIISKRLSPEILIDALKIIHAGGSPITPYIARNICSMFEKIVPDSENSLTQEEWIVLRQFSAGSSYASIAEKMFSSSADIQQIVRGIYQKLHNHPVSKSLCYKISGQ